MAAFGRAAAAGALGRVSHAATVGRPRENARGKVTSDGQTTLELQAAVAVAGGAGEEPSSTGPAGDCQAAGVYGASSRASGALCLAGRREHSRRRTLREWRADAGSVPRGLCTPTDPS